ncbi:hypothetical protein [Zestomonas carbonaria]|uniref:Uncharacterized protein n=1 Tax=Zestomonas carbonaria TaxID=2762745 RepID=A0A7U7ETN9_9GAMM|nr:hypothetical protein [Pseudomonas carbonaria]CAD5110405.1 hypothetical protein PSEWESI4_04728 [Pseudomonas carbonaria]
MSNTALDATLETLGQDAMEGNLPRPTTVCKDCTEVAVPFSINAGNGPRDADRARGIPSHDGAATEAWFLDNPWITDRIQNFRDTFLLRVLLRFGELKGEAYMAEFYTYIAAKGLELTSIENLMVTEKYITPNFMH